jgi:hypothetical protein
VIVAGMVALTAPEAVAVGVCVPAADAEGSREPVCVTELVLLTLKLCELEGVTEIEPVIEPENVLMEEAVRTALTVGGDDSLRLPLCVGEPTMVALWTVLGDGVADAEPDADTVPVPEGDGLREGDSVPLTEAQWVGDVEDEAPATEGVPLWLGLTVTEKEVVTQPVDVALGVTVAVAQAEVVAV